MNPTPQRLSTPTIAALSSPNVFACHCTNQGDRLVVGILAVNEDGFEFGRHTLYTANEAEAYTVEIAALSDNPSYGVELPIINA